MPSVAGSVSTWFPQKVSIINTYNLLETKGYQKYKEKLFLKYLYRKLGCLVAVGCRVEEKNARPDGAVPDAR